MQSSTTGRRPAIVMKKEEAPLLACWPRAKGAPGMDRYVCESGCRDIWIQTAVISGVNSRIVVITTCYQKLKLVQRKIERLLVESPHELMTLYELSLMVLNDTAT